MAWAWVHISPCTASVSVSGLVRDRIAHSISHRYSNRWRSSRRRPRRSFHRQSTLLYAEYRAEGALMLLVTVQLFAAGLYLPPVSKRLLSSVPPRRSFRCRSTPPCESIGQSDALLVLLAVQLFVPALYFPPVFK